ncbi:Reticulon-like protein B8 [Dionaea muscipula]
MNSSGKMSEKITSGNLMKNVMETIGDNVSNKNLQEDITKVVNSRVNRLFGRQNPIHKVLGGGKSADVLLWRNKKISGGVLAGATAAWVLFEWLNYHFLSIVCFLLAISLVVQFFWSNASGLVNRSPPRLTLPDEMFVNIAVSVGNEVNKALAFLQDVALGGNLKQFLAVVGVLFSVAIISSWCSFLTILYIGFVGAHTLPVLYEKYEDDVDSFVDNLLGKAQHQYKKIDTGFLSKIPSAKLRGYYNKYE